MATVTVLTHAGETWAADKLHETVQTTADHIGWGTGAGTATKASASLFAEAPEARVVATRTRPTTNMLRWVGTLTAAADRTITNAGNFIAATGGAPIVHGSFTGIPVANGNRLEITIELTIT